MRKKLVWLGLVLVLGVIMLSEVKAVTYGFMRTNDLCGSVMVNGPVDGTFIGKETDFKSEFFDQYTDNGFSVLSSPELIREGGKSCFGNVVEVMDEMGVFGYGYLYALDPLSETTFRVGSRSSRDQDWITTSRFMFYDITNYKSGSLKTYLDQSTSVGYCGEGIVVQDDNTGPDTGTIGPPWTTTESTCNLKLSEGKYFIAAGLVGYSPFRIGRLASVTFGSRLDLARFNTEDESAYNSIPNHIAINDNPRYVITTTLLSPLELNNVFGAYVENTSWLCNDAGGERIVDKYSALTEQALRAYGGFDMSHFCCGDDAAESYSFNYSGQTYYCNGGIWDTNSLSGACSELVQLNGNTGDKVYNPLLNTKPYLYYEIKDGAKNGSDGCCGDDIPGDYGFIASVPKQPAGSGNIYQYMCYADFSTTIDFQWLNAVTTAYKIKTINKTKDVDVISNSEEWFYCNATLDANITGGRSISEGSTFTPRFDNGVYSCAAWYTAASGNTHTFVEKCDFGPNGDKPAAEDCCDYVNLAPSTASDIKNCVNLCYLQGSKDYLTLGQLNSLMAAAPPGTTNTPSGWNEIDMDLCIEDRSTCYSASQPSTLESCDAQPPSALCNATSFCKGGITINTTAAESAANADKTCCIGENATCEPITNVKDADSCLKYGKIFSPNTYNYCTKPLIALPGTQNSFCCLGDIVVNKSYFSQTALLNTSVICFKEQGNNILSQCCYSSSCMNKDYVANAELLSSYDRRVLSKGASIHTLTNFDRIQGSGTNTIIRNLAVQRFFQGGLNGQSFSVGDSEAQHYPKFDGFKYLEFDLLTDATDLTLSFNGQDMGRMDLYSNNGGSAGIIHRISLPLDNFLPTETLHTIGFNSMDNRQIAVVLDNIVLVPETYNINTKPYYCTGGFEGWVEDLDAPVGTTDYLLYGPHMLACRGIASYGWTGSQCCGDDTKPRSALEFYSAEFYNDTIAGCFAGSKVLNNQSIAESRGVTESVVAAADKLRSFAYSDLLYYNNSFIGCQVPSGKYDSLHLSYSAVPESLHLLSSSNVINSQCTVVGSYYCEDGAWRKKIKTETAPLGEEFPGQSISLKMAPPGIELLKGGFRG